MPRSASERCVASYQSGEAPGARSAPIASGEPFTRQRVEAPPPRLLTVTTVDIRWSADEKWWRARILTEAVPCAAAHLRMSASVTSASAISFASASRCSGVSVGAEASEGSTPAALAGRSALAAAAVAASSASFLRLSESRRSSMAVAPGSAVCLVCAYVHCTPSSAASSMGSPTSSGTEETETSEWHPASTTAASMEASLNGTCAGAVGPSEPLVTPTGTSLSEVSVPVLSKSTESILPAKGTRYGSVQKMPFRISAIRAVLTAMAVCIGRWRGTTEVMMITHLSSNSCVVRSPRSIPLRST
mmetsp:Transcript_41907/g.103361  ORF Transcript_41907/g.103361 Transcript_41907/m.103361 type:complete len:303 (-) Transcript_41907:510-1418(-)